MAVADNALKTAGFMIGLPRCEAQSVVDAQRGLRPIPVLAEFGAESNGGV